MILGLGLMERFSDMFIHFLYADTNPIFPSHQDTTAPNSSGHEQIWTKIQKRELSHRAGFLILKQSGRNADTRDTALSRPIFLGGQECCSLSLTAYFPLSIRDDGMRTDGKEHGETPSFVVKKTESLRLDLLHHAMT